MRRAGPGRGRRAQPVEGCVGPARRGEITAEGLDSVRLLDEEVALALPVGHPLAGRTSVGVEELVGLPLIATRPGRWRRRLLDQLFAGHGLTPRIVCEGDEAGAIAELISTGLGIGLVPVIARRTISRVPLAWAGVDSPDCRRVLTLYWAQGGRLPAPARLPRDAIAAWGWEAGGSGAWEPTWPPGRIGARRRIRVLSAVPPARGGGSREHPAAGRSADER
ncbi:LysR family transcriptional regulator substrate-binding protein [Streptomyces laurentii]|uniref:LysR family transcriptional regulator substrate-binding protein n=1 Tax=Streptomyces laurentii TaxID=39478 RepID=UPI0036A8A198